MFSPDPAWPPQVKEEEGWRQGCTRAALRRKQFGEAAAAKLRGGCQRLEEVTSRQGRLSVCWPKRDRKVQGPAPLISNQGCRQ